MSASVHLTTDRLTLRPPVLQDGEAIHRLVNDWGIVRMLSHLPFPYPRPLTERWIASTADSRLAGTAHHFAVVARQDESEVLIGCVGIRIEDEGRTGDLGYWIGRRYWGQGFAREAAGRIARWALANLDIDLLSASVATDNPASASVLRRIGFRDAGQGSQHFEARGGMHPVWRFAATRDDLHVEARAMPAEPAATRAAEGVAARIVLVAAAALIDHEGRVMLARRPEGKRLAGLWEFPGGKVEPGESPEEALARELDEELGIDIAEGCLAPFGFASHDYGDFHLLMPLFVCRRWGGTPSGREGQRLAWVRPGNLADYPMTPAGKPLVPMLRGFL